MQYQYCLAGTVTWDLLSIPLMFFFPICFSLFPFSKARRNQDFRSLSRCCSWSECALWFHGFFGPDHFVVFNQVFLIDALWGMSVDIILSIANSAPKMEAHNGRPFVQVLLSQCLRFFSLGSTRLQNGRPQDMAKVCFGMLGAKTLWTPCGVKMRIRKGSSSGSRKKWPHHKFWDRFFGVAYAGPFWGENLLMSVKVLPFCKKCTLDTPFCTFGGGGSQPRVANNMWAIMLT